MCRGVIYDGYPSLEEIQHANGWPSKERFQKGPVAVIECVQQIPCNPCEGACPFHAIRVGEPITNSPRLEEEKCTGCGMCVAACSGLAIFVIDKSYSDVVGKVSFPFEYLPLPEKGSVVNAVGRDGKYLCKGTVTRIMTLPKNDHTAVITVEVPLEFIDMCRGMERLNAEDRSQDFHKIDPVEYIDDDVLVCRCEEVTAGAVRKAIREQGATTVTDIKRRTRSGMGLCQGKSCGKIIARIISEELGKTAPEVLPATDRAPVRPVTFGELMGEVKGGQIHE